MDFFELEMHETDYWAHTYMCGSWPESFMRKYLTVFEKTRNSFANSCKKGDFEKKGIAPLLPPEADRDIFS